MRMSGTTGVPTCTPVPGKVYVDSGARSKAGASGSPQNLSTASPVLFYVIALYIKLIYNLPTPRLLLLSTLWHTVGSVVLEGRNLVGGSRSLWATLRFYDQSPLPIYSLFPDCGYIVAHQPQTLTTKPFLRWWTVSPLQPMSQNKPFSPQVVSSQVLGCSFESHN